MRLTKALFVLLILGLGLTSCSKKAIIRRYYVLENQLTIPKNTYGIEQAFPYKVDVRDFRVSKAFDQTRIAIRSESHELNYYFYHHWAVRPASAISDLVYSLIDRSGIFQRCSREYSLNPDFKITGIVRVIERIQTKDSTAAHIQATFQLFDAQSDLEALRYEFDRTTLLNKNKSMNKFAGAMSEILREEIESFIKKIVEHFKSNENS